MNARRRRGGTERKKGLVGGESCRLHDDMCEYRHRKDDGLCISKSTSS